MIGGIQALVWALLGCCTISYQEFWHQTDLMGDFFSTDGPDNHLRDREAHGSLTFDQQKENVVKELTNRGRYDYPFEENLAAALIKMCCCCSCVKDKECTKDRLHRKEIHDQNTSRVD
jgi:hypothetical protein